MLTEREAWQKIYDAFERYENGELNRLAATGICNAVARLYGDCSICGRVFDAMADSLTAALCKSHYDPDSLCWPTTPEGAASRCEFIREHFLKS